MPVSLSIKGVPDAMVVQLRHRARQHHRSLQGELMAILDESLNGVPRLTTDEAISQLKALRLHTLGDSTAMIREDRDAR
ncbi:MAG: Arc family DNA-binding protein [Chloroflexi bacterium]|nr:Arc family DNA-binding protein [Chloroflexota bacterium]